MSTIPVPENIALHQLGELTTVPSNFLDGHYEADFTGLAPEQKVKRALVAQSYLKSNPRVKAIMESSEAFGVQNLKNLNFTKDTPKPIAEIESLFRTNSEPLNGRYIVQCRVLQGNVSASVSERMEWESSVSYSINNVAGSTIVKNHSFVVATYENDVLKSVHNVINTQLLFDLINLDQKIDATLTANNNSNSSTTNVRFVKQIPFADGQQIQIAAIETAFRKTVSTTVLNGYYIGSFRCTQANALSAIGELDFVIDGNAQSIPVFHESILVFMYENNVLTEIEVQNDAQLISKVLSINTQVQNLINNGGGSGSTYTMLEYPVQAYDVNDRGNISGIIKCSLPNGLIMSNTSLHYGLFHNVYVPNGVPDFRKLVIIALSGAFNASGDFLFAFHKDNFTAARDLTFSKALYPTPKVATMPTDANGNPIDPTVNAPMVYLDSAVVPYEIIEDFKFAGQPSNMLIYRFKNTGQFNNLVVSFDF